MIGRSLAADQNMCGAKHWAAHPTITLALVKQRSPDIGMAYPVPRQLEGLAVDVAPCLLHQRNDSGVFFQGDSIFAEKAAGHHRPRKIGISLRKKEV